MIPYIPKDLDTVAGELKAWIDGGSNPMLDKWYKDYREHFSGLIHSNNDIIKVTDSHPKLQKLLNDLHDMKDIDITERRKFAKRLLESLDLDEVPISIRHINAKGQCALNIENNTITVKEYVLNSEDLRSDNYKIKTVFHEAYHAKANGLATDYLKNPSIWLDIEETFAEASAHYLYKEFGLGGHITPAYPEKLVEILPRLKKLDKFKDCETIEDFGKIAWEDRLDGAPAVWRELYDLAMGTDHNWTEYLGKYSEYINENKSDLLDLMLENMPQYKEYKDDMSLDYDNALKKIKEGRRLSGNETMVTQNLLANAMKILGVK